jgi:hypothetical protein
MHGRERERTAGERNEKPLPPVADERKGKREERRRQEHP